MSSILDTYLAQSANIPYASEAELSKQAAAERAAREANIASGYADYDDYGAAFERAHDVATADTNLLQKMWDVPIGATAAGIDAVGSGFFASPVTSPIANGLRSLQTQDYKDRQLARMYEHQAFDAHNQKLYNQDIASGKSETEASLAKIGRQAMNWWNDSSAGDIIGDSANAGGSLIGSFIVGGVYGKMISGGLKAIAAARTASHFGTKIKNYEQGIATLETQKQQLAAKLAELEKSGTANPELLTQAQTELKGLEAEIEKATQEANAARAANEANKASLEAKNAEIQDLSTKVEEANSNFKNTEDLYFSEYMRLKNKRLAQGYSEEKAEDLAWDELFSTDLAKKSRPAAAAASTKAERNLATAEDEYSSLLEQAKASRHDTAVSLVAQRKAQRAYRAKEEEIRALEEANTAKVAKVNETKDTLSQVESGLAANQKSLNTLKQREAKLTDKLEAKAEMKGAALGGHLTNFAFGASEAVYNNQDLDAVTLETFKEKGAEEYLEKFKDLTNGYVKQGLSQSQAEEKAFADIKNGLKLSSGIKTGLWETAMGVVTGRGKVQGLGVKKGLFSNSKGLLKQLGTEDVEEIGQTFGEDIFRNLATQKLNSDVETTKNLGRDLMQTAVTMPIGMAGMKAAAKPISVTASVARGTAKLASAIAKGSPAKQAQALRDNITSADSSANQALDKHFESQDETYKKLYSMDSFKARYGDSRENNVAQPVIENAISNKEVSDDVAEGFKSNNMAKVLRSTIAYGKQLVQQIESASEESKGDLYDKLNAMTAYATVLSGHALLSSQESNRGVQESSAFRYLQTTIFEGHPEVKKAFIERNQKILDEVLKSNNPNAEQIKTVMANVLASATLNINLGSSVEEIEETKKQYDSLVSKVEASFNKLANSTLDDNIEIQRAANEMKKQQALSNYILEFKRSLDVTDTNSDKVSEKEAKVIQEKLLNGSLQEDGKVSYNSFVSTIKTILNDFAGTPGIAANMIARVLQTTSDNNISLHRFVNNQHKKLADGNDLLNKAKNGKLKGLKIVRGKKGQRNYYEYEGNWKLYINDNGQPDITALENNIKRQTDEYNKLSNLYQQTRTLVQVLSQEVKLDGKGNIDVKSTINPPAITSSAEDVYEAMSDNNIVSDNDRGTYTIKGARSVNVSLILNGESSNSVHSLDVLPVFLQSNKQTNFSYDHSHLEDPQIQRSAEYYYGNKHIVYNSIDVFILTKFALGIVSRALKHPSSKPAFEKAANELLSENSHLANYIAQGNMPKSIQYKDVFTPESLANAHINPTTPFLNTSGLTVNNKVVDLGRFTTGLNALYFGAREAAETIDVTDLTQESPEVDYTINNENKSPEDIQNRIDEFNIQNDSLLNSTSNEELNTKLDQEIKSLASQSNIKDNLVAIDLLVREKINSFGTNIINNVINRIGAASSNNITLDNVLNELESHEFIGFFNLRYIDGKFSLQLKNAEGLRLAYTLSILEAHTSAQSSLQGITADDSLIDNNNNNSVLLTHGDTDNFTGKKEIKDEHYNFKRRFNALLDAEHKKIINWGQFSDILSKNIKNILTINADRSAAPAQSVNAHRGMAAVLATSMSGLTDSNSKQGSLNVVDNKIARYDLFSVTEGKNKEDKPITIPGSVIANIVVLPPMEKFDAFSFKTKVDKIIFDANQDAEVESVIVTSEQWEKVQGTNFGLDSRIRRTNEKVSSSKLHVIKSLRDIPHKLNNFGRKLLDKGLTAEGWANALRPMVDYKNELAKQAEMAAYEANVRNFEATRAKAEALKEADAELHYLNDTTKVNRLNNKDSHSYRDDKTSRDFITPFEIDIDSSFRNDHDGILYDLWQRAILQGIGLKVEGLSREEIRDRYKARAKQLQDFKSSGNYTYQDFINFITDGSTNMNGDSAAMFAAEFLNSIGENRTVAGIHNVFEMAQDAQGIDFKSSIYGEADGITNGVFFTKLLYSVRASLATNNVNEAIGEIYNLARVGFGLGYVPESQEQGSYKDLIAAFDSFNTTQDKLWAVMTSDKKIIDCYTAVQNKINEQISSSENHTSLVEGIIYQASDNETLPPEGKIKPLARAVMMITKAIGYAVHYDHNTGSISIEAPRTPIKEAFMPFNYDAGSRSVAVSMTENLKLYVAQSFNQDIAPIVKRIQDTSIDSVITEENKKALANCKQLLNKLFAFEYTENDTNALEYFTKEEVEDFFKNYHILTNSNKQLTPDEVAKYIDSFNMSKALFIISRTNEVSVDRDANGNSSLKISFYQNDTEESIKTIINNGKFSGSALKTRMEKYLNKEIVSDPTEEDIRRYLDRANNKQQQYNHKLSWRKIVNPGQGYTADDTIDQKTISKLTNLFEYCLAKPIQQAVSEVSGESVDSDSNKVTVSSASLITAVCRNMLVKHIMYELNLTPDGANKTLDQQLRYAFRKLSEKPKEEQTRILRDVFRLYPLAFSYSEHTKVFINKEDFATINDVTSGQVNAVAGNKNNNVGYNPIDKVRIPIDGGVAARPVTNISLGDGFTMDEIISYCHEQGINLQDVFDGINCSFGEGIGYDPDHKLNQAFNKAAFESAVTQNPMQGVTDHLRHVIDSLSFIDTGIVADEDSFYVPARTMKTIGELTTSKDTFNDPYGDISLTVGQVKEYLKGLSNVSQSHAERIEAEHAAYCSMYVPLVVNQYAMDPSGAFIKHGCVVDSQGKVFEITGSINPAVMTEYISLVKDVLAGNSKQDALYDFLDRNGVSLTLIKESNAEAFKKECTYGKQMEMPKLKAKHLVDKNDINSPLATPEGRFMANPSPESAQRLLDTRTKPVSEWVSRLNDSSNNNRFRKVLLNLFYSDTSRNKDKKLTRINLKDYKFTKTQLSYILTELKARGYNTDGVLDAFYDEKGNLIEDQGVYLEGLNGTDVIIGNSRNTSMIHEYGHLAFNKAIRHFTNNINDVLFKSIVTYLKNYKKFRPLSDKHGPLAELINALITLKHDKGCQHEFTDATVKHILNYIVDENGFIKENLTKEDLTKALQELAAQAWHHPSRTDNQKSNPFPGLSRLKGKGFSFKNWLTTIVDKFKKLLGIDITFKEKAFTTYTVYAAVDALNAYQAQIDVALNSNDNSQETVTPSLARANSNNFLKSLKTLIDNKKKDPGFSNLQKAFTYRHSADLADIRESYMDAYPNTPGIDSEYTLASIQLIDEAIKGKYIPASLMLDLQKIHSKFLASESFTKLPDEIKALLLGSRYLGNGNYAQRSKESLSGLTNFVAMHYMFRDSLDKISMKEKANKSGILLEDMCLEVSNKVIDAIMNKLSAGKQLDRTLAQISANSESESLNQKVVNAISTIERAGNKVVLSTIRQGINRVATVLGKGSPLAEAVALATRNPYEEVNIGLGDIMGRLANEIASNVRLSPTLRALLNDLAGATKYNINALKLFKKSKALIDKEFLARMHSYPAALEKNFVGLEQKHLKVIKRLFIDLDMSALSSSGIEGILDFISDQRHLNVMPQLNLTAYQERKCHQLAEYLVSGKTGKLLLRNAHAIAVNVSPNTTLNLSEVSKTDIEKIDRYVSMLALNKAFIEDNNFMQDLTDLKDLLKKDPKNIKAMNFFMQSQQALKNNELKKLGHNIFNYTKGYSPSYLLNQISTRAVAESQVQKLKELGWKDTGNILPKASGDNDTTNYHIMYNPIPQPSFKKGIFQISNENVYGLNSSGFAVDNIAPPTRSYNPNVDTGSAYSPVPVFNNKGKIIYYERVNPYKDLFKTEQDPFKLLGIWSANSFMSDVAYTYNEKALVKNKEMYDLDVKERPDSVKRMWVDINEIAKTDPVVKDAFSKIPLDIRNKWAAQFNGKHLIRRDTIDLFLGYKEASITDAWTGVTRWSPRTCQTVIKISNAIFGKDAYAKLAAGERTIKYGMAAARNAIVIRSIALPYINATANIVQLRTMGIPFNYIAPAVVTKVQELEYYHSLEKRIYSYQVQLDANPNVAIKTQLRARINNLKDKERELSVWPMIAQGELSTLNDVGDSYNESLLTGKWAENFDKAVEQIPDSLVKAGKFLTVSKDTALYKLMEKSTIYGDFIAKSILFDWLVKHDISKERAQLEVIDSFVNYDMMGGRTREYLENLGLGWFWNYKLRITKTAMNVATKHPLSSLLILNGLPDTFTDQNVYSDNVVAKILTNKIWATTGPSVDMALSYILRNPFINMLF